MDYPYRFTKTLPKKDKTNADKIEGTDNTYMHTKTNRNMHRHIDTCKHRNTKIFKHSKTKKKQKNQYK